MHTILLAAALLLLMSPLGNKPGMIHPALIVPFFYLLLSPFPYFASLIRGIYEISKTTGTVGSGIAIASCLVILSAMTYGIIRMWPAWMGI
ncbi:MAG: hypothetical protein ABIT37_11485 [Luteolibacter sp.]